MTKTIYATLDPSSLMHMVERAPHMVAMEMNDETKIEFDKQKDNLSEYTQYAFNKLEIMSNSTLGNGIILTKVVAGE